jgi:hypothetical protein
MKTGREVAISYTISKDVTHASDKPPGGCDDFLVGRVNHPTQLSVSFMPWMSWAALCGELLQARWMADAGSSGPMVRGVWHD